MKKTTTAKLPVINWFPEPKKFTAGLREKLTDTKENFVTIRLGEKWYVALSSGDRVALSISKDAAQPKVIGHAEVVSSSFDFIFALSERVLSLNIGAKTWQQVLKDMRSVYGRGKVNKLSIISVIELRPCR